MKKLTSLCLVLLACASAVQAASKPAPAPAPSCDRECLRGMITAYLYSLVKHDTSKLPVSDTVRVTEDAVHPRVPIADRKIPGVDLLGGFDGALFNPAGFSRGYPALTAAISQIKFPERFPAVM